jgi:uncharacterized protein (DUF58 family)
MGADVVVDYDLVPSVEPESHLRARLDTFSAAVALVDRVGVVAGDAIEVAALEEHDESVARPINGAEPDYVIQVALGCSHG